MNKEQTLEYLASHDENVKEKYDVVSDWLCDELDRFEMDGYVYNAEAFDRICLENGIDAEYAKRRVVGNTIRTEGGLLGSLIYNAQKYRRKRKLVRSGWIAATQEVLARFAGRKVLAFANGELSGEKIAKVKLIGDRLRLCPEKSRTKAFVEYMDWWVKPIEA